MVNEWMVGKIGHCFDLIGGYAFKSGEFIESGIPVIKIKNVKANRMVFDDLSYVHPEFLKTRMEKVVRKGDLLITMSGNRFDGSPDTWVGKVAQFNEERPFMLNQRVGVLRPKNNTEVDRRFFSYLLSSQFYQTEFISIATSSGGQANLSPSQILGAPIAYPPLSEQRAIAAVLGALDDKIELNRRMNATLESMARALFQSWFVDFDPVRAKLDPPAAHHPPALDPATAALFPDSFEDSPLGQIPQGWRVQRLPDAIEVNPRRTLKIGTIAPYLDMKNLPTQGHSAEEVIDREFSSGTKFQNGDTLLARITPCLENGKTGYVDFLEYGQVGWGSTEYIVLSPKPPLPSQFGYLLARSDALRSHAIQNMTGTSGRQRVPSECFHNFWLAVPPPSIAKCFDELTAPLMAKIKANSTESRTLATLRDTLLPKLLSGELSVAGATHAMEQA